MNEALNQAFFDRFLPVMQSLIENKVEPDISFFEDSPLPSVCLRKEKHKPYVYLYSYTNNHFLVTTLCAGKDPDRFDDFFAALDHAVHLVMAQVDKEDV